MENNIIEIWEKNNHAPQTNKLDKDMITKHIAAKASKASRTFTSNLLTYLTALMASIVLLSMNIYGYRFNPVMFWVEIGLLFLSLLFLGYGAFVFIKLREINNFTKNLHELLNEKLKFIKVHYEIWLIITALIVVILSFSLNSLVDNQDGIFRINKVKIFVFGNIAMFGFIYVVQKISAATSTNMLKAYLNDLKANYLDQTNQIESRRKKLRWVYIISGLILLGGFILGILKAFAII